MAMTLHLSSVLLLALLCNYCCVCRTTESSSIYDLIPRNAEYVRRGLETQLIAVFDDLRNVFDQPESIMETEVKSQSHHATEGRTFGAIKRLQFALLPIMYKMGVMSTMLVVLTIISFKGLVIGVILLVLNLGTTLAKLHIGKQDHKDVHVHIHNDNAIPHYGPHPHYDPYSRKVDTRNDLLPINYYQTNPLDPPLRYSFYTENTGYPSPYERQMENKEDPGVLRTVMHSFNPYGVKSVSLPNNFK